MEGGGGQARAGGREREDEWAGNMAADVPLAAGARERTTPRQDLPCRAIEAHARVEIVGRRNICHQLRSLKELHMLYVYDLEGEGDRRYVARLGYLAWHRQPCMMYSI